MGTATARTARTTRPKPPDHPVHAALARIPNEAPPRATIELGIAEAKRRLEALDRFHAHPNEYILPIESDAVVPAARRAREEITSERRQLESILKHPAYRPMDLALLRETLRWRNADGWPVLAPFSITSAEVRFRVQPRPAWEGGSGRWVDPQVPDDIRQCYDDVFDALERRIAGARREASLSVAFTGALPAAVRKAIRAARSEFSTILVLTEVEQWKLEERDLPVLRADPLVVGSDGAAWFFITSFDTTPLEDAVRELCTGGASKA